MFPAPSADEPTRRARRCTEGLSRNLPRQDVSVWATPITTFSPRRNSCQIAHRCPTIFRRATRRDLTRNRAKGCRRVMCAVLRCHRFIQSTTNAKKGGVPRALGHQRIAYSLPDCVCCGAPGARSLTVRNSVAIICPPCARPPRNTRLLLSSFGTPTCCLHLHVSIEGTPVIGPR